MNRKRIARKSFRQAQQRHGAAIVEFAVVSPILILMILGMIDVGRAVMVQNLLTNAARDGARAAVLDGASASAIESEVESFLAASSVSGATVTVSPNPLTTATQGDPVTVTVQVPFSSVSWLPASPYFAGVNLQSTIIMRKESGTF